MAPEDKDWMYYDYKKVYWFPRHQARRFYITKRGQYTFVNIPFLYYSVSYKAVKKP
jgi:hypothetical protein